MHRSRTSDSAIEVDVVTTPRKTKRPRRLVRAASERQCIGIRSGCDALACLGHHRPQLLAGLEDRYRTRRHFDRVTGAWVARHPSLALADLERAKSANFNVMLLCECRFDRVEK